MSRIRGRGNRTTELAMAKLFRRHGIAGWRRNQNVFGKPDFLFRKVRLALFVDGCFWHGCPAHGRKPASNRVYWLKKIERNRHRDASVNKTLKKRGWIVIRFWEHDLAKPKKCVQRVIQAFIHARKHLKSVPK